MDSHGIPLKKDLTHEVVPSIGHLLVARITLYILLAIAAGRNIMWIPRVSETLSPRLRTSKILLH